MSASSQMTLGKTNLLVPRLGVGAMTWGNPPKAPWWKRARLAYAVGSSREELQKALDASLAAGVNFIDTAAAYAKGACEGRIGELTFNRDDVFIATKFPMDFPSFAEGLPSVLDGSLARLGRSCVDLYQIHYPSPSMPIPRLMHLMAEAFHAGKIRAAGVSNFSAEEMRLAHAVLAEQGIALASNQVEYSLLHRQPETDGVMDACRELGVTLIAHTPLAMGALTGKYSPTARPSGRRRFMRTFWRESMVRIARIVDLLREIGRAYDRSPAQVALRFLIEQGDVLPIPGARNAEQAAHNAGALSFALTEAELEALRRATLAYRS